MHQTNFRDPLVLLRTFPALLLPQKALRTLLLRQGVNIGNADVSEQNHFSLKIDLIINQ